MIELVCKFWLSESVNLPMDSTSSTMAARRSQPATVSPNLLKDMFSKHVPSECLCNLEQKEGIVMQVDFKENGRPCEDC